MTRDPSENLADKPTLDRRPAVNVDSLGSGAENASLEGGGSPSEDVTAVRTARDRTVACIAAKRRTIVTAAELAACGVGPDAVAYRIKSGRLRPQFSRRVLRRLR
jgi:hypothetical protein